MPASRTITWHRAVTAALATVMTLSLLPAATLGYAEPPKDIRLTEWKVLAEINHIRASHGLRPLRMAFGVRRVARDRSRDMRRYDYFGHSSPSGRDAATLLQRRRINYSAGSENIGWMTFLGWERTPAGMVKGWFDSSGHRANLLSHDYNYVGIGMALDGNASYFTAIFLRQKDHTPPRAGFFASHTGISVAGVAGLRPVTIRWYGRDKVLQRETAGLRGFTVQKKVGTDKWRTLKHNTMSRSLTLDLGSGRHKFRVRAVDNRGNVGPWGKPLTVTVL